MIVRKKEEVPAEIPPTVHNKSTSTEVRFIAMISPHKTSILRVFPTQKDAVEYCNLNSTGFTRAIKQGTLSANHYWNYFDACDEQMKTEYLAHNKLPDKHVFTKGTQVQQIDPQTGIVLKTYPSKRDIAKEFQMSMATLNKNMEDKTIYKGFVWIMGTYGSREGPLP